MTRKFNRFKWTKENLEAGLGYEMKTHVQQTRFPCFLRQDYQSNNCSGKSKKKKPKKNHTTHKNTFGLFTFQCQDCVSIRKNKTRSATQTHITFFLLCHKKHLLERAGVSAPCPFSNSQLHFQRQFSFLCHAPRLLWTYLPRESGLNCIFLFPPKTNNAISCNSPLWLSSTFTTLP